MYFWGNDFETLCEKNCRQYRVYADIYPKNDSGGYDGSPYVTYTATRGSADAGAISFETAAIVSVKIVRGITSGAFSYGGAFGGQLTLVTTADTKIPADDTKIVISVSFVSEEGAETGKAILGTFFSETVASGQFTKTIKAVDGISKLTKYYVPNPEEFPMTAMELFKKAAVAAGVDPALSETDFKLNNPNITEAPFKKKEDLEERENSDQAEDEYYTYREIAGMIASINAGNAFVSALNHLNISTPDTNLKREIPIKSVISYTDNEVVNQFTTTFWAQTYEGEGTPPEIDPLSENYNPSVMVVDFPLKTDSDYAAMQANIDSRIGGISYNGIVIKKQGTGRQEIGDLLAFNDTYRNKKFNNVLVMGIVYDISANNGFTETLYSLSQSEAKQQAKGISTNTKVDKLESKAGSGGGTASGGVGMFTNEEKNSEIFNCYNDVINENGAYSQRKNYINQKTKFAHVGGRSNFIDEDDEITNYSTASAVLCGEFCEIVSSDHSAVACGGSNKIIKAPFGFIGGGTSNIVSNNSAAVVAGGGNKSSGYAAVILTGDANEISGSSNYSAILGGQKNKILNGMDNAIICGMGNSIETTGLFNAIVAGNGNKINGYAHGNAILCGFQNEISENVFYSCIASGLNNKIKGHAYGSLVVGNNNTCSMSNSITAGVGADNQNYYLAIGGGSGNVFYVDTFGNAYAKSFNIIGETQSEASTFSAISSDTPDLSELTAQISEIKADIEALRAENQTLRAEIKSLKANL